MEWYELAESIQPELKKGNIDSCISVVSKNLEKVPKTPFHLVLEAEFSNDTNEVARYFEGLIRRNSSLKAIYTETNGFDINPDQWYFDLFGYYSYGGLDDIDWLSNWDDESKQSMVLVGMEKLQGVYAEPSNSDPKYSSAWDLCSLLVVLKFQKLIQCSAQKICNLNIPILATSHDYDFIYEHGHS